MSEAEFWATTPRYLSARLKIERAKERDRLQYAKITWFFIAKTVDHKGQLKGPDDLFKETSDKESWFDPADESRRAEEEAFGEEADKIIQRFREMKAQKSKQT